MALTVVSRMPPANPPRRFGAWVKISVSLMVLGLAALVVAGVVGVNWYYGLHKLVANGGTSSARVAVGQPYLIDELVAASGDAAVVDIRAVSVDLDANSAAATATVESCVGYSRVTACDDPTPFRPGLFNLTSQRVVVVIRAARAGSVRVQGVRVSYRAGVRSATQHVGPSVTLQVT